VIKRVPILNGSDIYVDVSLSNVANIDYNRNILSLKINNCLVEDLSAFSHLKNLHCNACLQLSTLPSIMDSITKLEVSECKLIQHLPTGMVNLENLLVSD
jgi:hypothetical protein